MSHAPEPLHDLLAQAALASGRPILHLRHPELEAAEHALQQLVPVLGPLPQAELVEPWEDEPWELRIELPGLHPTQWDVVRRLVSDVSLQPGRSPGARLAEDEGVCMAEVVEVDGLRFTLWLDENGPLTPDLARARSADAEVQALEVELAEAVRTVGADQVFRSDRGPDTVTPVIHRTSGRFGVQLGFDAGSVDQRDAILAAVARVVRGRAAHPTLRLAPDPWWEVRLDALVLTLWIIGPAAPGLPGDEVVHPADLHGLLADPSQCEELEVQVLPTGPHTHDAVVEHVVGLLDGAPQAETNGWRAGGPRWLRTADGWRFTPTWRVAREQVGGLTDWIGRISGLDPVAMVRVVPGEPTGLGEVWRWTDPAWTWAGRRCFLRVRDAVTDRDRLPVAEDRPGSPRDAELDRIVRALLRIPRPTRPIVDPGRREGLELVLGPWSFAEEPLRTVLGALGEIDGDALAPVAHLAHRSDHTLVRLWYRSEACEPPPWR